MKLETSPVLGKLLFKSNLLQLQVTRGGLVVGRPIAVREDPGSNLTAAGLVYHDSHCDTQPWARVVHPYCSAFHPLWDGKMSISLRAE